MADQGKQPKRERTSPITIKFGSFEIQGELRPILVLVLGGILGIVASLLVIFVFRWPGFAIDYLLRSGDAKVIAPEVDSLVEVSETNVIRPAPLHYRVSAGTIITVTFTGVSQNSGIWGVLHDPSSDFPTSSVAKVVWNLKRIDNNKWRIVTPSRADEPILLDICLSQKDVKDCSSSPLLGRLPLLTLSNSVSGAR